MKTWKLVSGILCMVFFVIVAFQSCAVGVGEALMEEESASGGFGLLLAIFMLAAGIVSVATRNGGHGSNIALVVLFGLAALLGWAGSGGMYGDITIWAAWCLICAVLALVALIRVPKGKDEE